MGLDQQFLPGFGLFDDFATPLPLFTNSAQSVGLPVGVLHLTDLAGQLPNGFGSGFVLLPVVSWKLHGICDRCRHLVTPSKAFFDGEKFLCPECRVSPGHAPGSLLR